ncbi:MAG: MerC domain-containing protein [Bacteroidota bacterium]|uniref:MerC domain-containing protein n=1 Tax=Nonlabens tegetincola TaxID=323273 RepID=UPI002E8AB069|nr:MerC domain-containing protein [Bacteroidota bacterium]
MKVNLLKPDVYGATASIMCIIHCVATPILFIAHAHTHGTVDHHNHAAAPIWWDYLDFIFLFVSFIAIKQTLQKSSRNWMKYVLWSTYSLLFLLIVNEKIEIIALAESVTYGVAIVLAGLHLFHLKYCQCNDEQCCIH